MEILVRHLDVGEICFGANFATDDDRHVVSDVDDDSSLVCSVQV